MHPLLKNKPKIAVDAGIRNPSSRITNIQRHLLDTQRGILCYLLSNNCVAKNSITILTMNSYNTNIFKNAMQYIY